MCMPYPFTDVRKNSTKSRRCQQWGIFACRCHRTSPRMSSGFYWESPRSPSTGDPTLPARPSDGSERYHRFLPYLVASTHPTSNDYKFTNKNGWYYKFIHFSSNLDNLRVENKNGWNHQPLVLFWVPWIPLLEWTSTSSTKNRTVNLKKKTKKHFEWKGSSNQGSVGGYFQHPFEGSKFNSNDTQRLLHCAEEHHGKPAVDGQPLLVFFTL